jgi:uncharacterized membrane protein YkoI
VRPGTVLRGLLLACALAAGAGSARELDHDEALQSLDVLLGKVRERHPGATLLEAELEDEHDHLVYELDVLTGNGAVRELEFDARSGELLKDEEEH